jgi:hypothetical protein
MALLNLSFSSFYHTSIKSDHGTPREIQVQCPGTPARARAGAGTVRDSQTLILSGEADPGGPRRSHGMVFRISLYRKHAKKGVFRFFRMKVRVLRVALFCVLPVACLGFQTSLVHIPQCWKFRPTSPGSPSQRQWRLLNLKPASFQRAHTTTLKSLSNHPVGRSTGPKWTFSRTKKFNYFVQRLNYFVQRLLVGGILSKLAIFMAVTAIFIFGGAFFIWLACSERCSIEYALSKSYMLLFRSVP